jgi:hypothetical protein
LTRLNSGNNNDAILAANPDIVFQYDQAYVERKTIAP